MDFFENQVCYLEAVHFRFENFLVNKKNLLQEVKDNLIVENTSEFSAAAKLKKTLKPQAIALSREFTSILNDVRSTLDTTIATIAKMNGCDIDSFKQSRANFPIYKNEIDWNRAEKMLEKAKIPKAVINGIRDMQPFSNFGTDPNTGENILILLNDLNNYGKHSGHLDSLPFLMFEPKRMEHPDICIDIDFNKNWIFDEALLVKITSSQKIKDPKLSLNFDVFFSHGEYKSINSEGVIVNTINTCHACLENFRLILNPEKSDYFGIPLVKK